MTIYIKKIYNCLNNNESKYFILAAKTTSAGHHILDLDRNLKILRTRILHKKIKLNTVKESGMSAKIEKTKKNSKLHYNILKIYKNTKT
jgi:hypothetical protein